MASLGGAPGYWPNETSGVLRPVVEPYLRAERLTPEQIPVMRAYLRQWINAPFMGTDGLPGFLGVEGLRDALDSLTNHAQVETWLRAANELGIDPF